MLFSNRMTTITYNDTRFGDTFNMWLDEADGYSIVGIQRFVGNIGGDPINYDSLDQLPAIYRHALEQELHRFKKNQRQ